MQILNRVPLALAGLILLASPALAQPKITFGGNSEDKTKLELEVGETRLLMTSQKIIRISVADPEVCDVQVVTPLQVMVTAKGVGFTDITMWGENDIPTTLAASATRNLDQLRRQLTELFPDEKLQVSSAGDLLVLSGKVSDLRLPARAAEVASLYSEKIANLIEVTGDQQVQLDVRFAEVSRTGTRRMGLEFIWSDPDRGGGSLGGITQTNPALTTPGAPVPLPTTSGGMFNLFFSTGLSDFPFAAVLAILKQEGLAKVLAEPTLVAMSGQQAEFHAGGEIPILTVQSLGQANVLFKKFGVRLRFVPTVLGNRTISMKLYVEVSEPDEAGGVSLGGFNIPAFRTRSSETTVRLKDGQSFAIAGLLSDDTRQVVRKVPWLGQLPVLGALFRSVSFQREETELLVVVTGRLVQPVSEMEVPLLPGEDAITDPGDLELFFGLGSVKYQQRDGDEVRDEHKMRGNGYIRRKTAPAPAPVEASGPMGFSRQL